MGIFIPIVLMVDVVITIETKAFFHKKRGLCGPFDFGCSDPEHADLIAQFT